MFGYLVLYSKNNLKLRGVREIEFQVIGQDSYNSYMFLYSFCFVLQNIIPLLNNRDWMYKPIFVLLFLIGFM